MATTTSAAQPSACATAAVRSTRVWPSRSISLPWATAPSALPIPHAPTTRSAIANELVASCASSSTASPNIPIGIEPIAEAITGGRAPGSASSAA